MQAASQLVVPRNNPRARGETPKARSGSVPARSRWCLRACTHISSSVGLRLKGRSGAAAGEAAFVIPDDNSLSIIRVNDSPRRQPPRRPLITLHYRAAS